MVGQKSGKHVTQNGIGQGHRKGISKSRSTPAKMDKFQRPDSQQAQQQRSNKQFIEDLMERDFLERCPLHWGGGGVRKLKLSYVHFFAVNHGLNSNSI